MSNIFQLYARKNNGSVPLSVGTGLLVDPIKSQGLNLSEDGGIYAAQAGTINHHNQGLPFDENGRLVVEVADISYYSMGIPFTVSGAVAIGGDVFRYDQGVGFTEEGFLATGEAPYENLYFNPEMAGGGTMVGTTGDLPDNHVIGNSAGDIVAEYLGEGAEPSYIFNADFDTGRLAFRQVRSTTGDLITGHRYRFSAEVYIDGYDGSEPQELRGININNNAAIVVNRDNADHSGNNGTWEYVEVLMDVIGTSTTIYLAHGHGVIFTSDCEQRTRSLFLADLGETPPDFNTNDFLNGDFAT